MIPLGSSNSNNNDNSIDKIESYQFSIINNIEKWGRSPVPPTLLATLVTALHFRPFQPFPMVFPPVLLFSSYLNLQDLTRESSGLSAAWSGLYLLMAKRRKNNLGQSLKVRVKKRFGARGLTRGAAMGVAAVNLVCGGMVYVLDKESNDGSAL